MNPKRARSWKRRRQPRGWIYVQTLSQTTTGGQGVHREVESGGFAEQSRAVVEGVIPQDEPVGQRWGKVEPALWGRRRSHPPTAPRCLRTARDGRSMRDPRRAPKVSVWQRDKQPYKSWTKWEARPWESSDSPIVPQARRKPGDRAIGSRVGWGRGLAEVVGARQRGKRSKEDGADKFLE